MPLFNRPDGKLARDVPATRQIMPFLMPTRTESAVYFEQEIDLTRTVPFIEAYNARRGRRITLFHVFLWAVVRTLHERPRLNRFVSGGRVYERDGIWISYSAKKALEDGSPIVVVKRQFDPSMSFDALVDRMHEDLSRARSHEKSSVDRELGLVLWFPAFIIRFLMGLLRRLDAWNLLPGGFIRSDPLYASLFIANLGSVKLDSAYHHLYEYGTISAFAAIGKTREVRELGPAGEVVTRQVCSVRYTLDERVEDGLYCARALELLRTMVEDPAGAMAREGSETGGGQQSQARGGIQRAS